jgi:hypothetical protein
VVKVLSGQGSRSVTVKNGQVTVGLGPLIDQAKQRLAARGLTIADKLKIVLPIAALLLFGIGIYIARSHRRALIGAGLGLAVSMFVLAAGLLIFRGSYLNGVPSSRLPADAAAALFDTLVRFIRAGLRTLLVVGLVAAAGAFLTGPSVAAVRIRESISSTLRWLRERGELAGVRTGPVGQWTYAHRTALRISATSLAVLAFVFWGRPTGAVVIVLAALLLLVLGLIELIGRPPAGAPAGAEAPHTGG